ncbi:AsnC family transcriptional regulator [Streptomyces sp. NPDC047315]|uniref:Lrp/AsnC family transcriptional regulator n=1 Tax=Streptomyces sp. NPDC047315 TaxID=3155142 RepID=UPI0033DB8192
MLDPLDLKLLQALQLDARAPFSRLAQVLDVSDQTVARRFRRLRATTRLRVVGVADETRLGRTNWLVRLGCASDGAANLATALARRSDTAWVGLLSGGTEVLCVMQPRSAQDRDELLLGRLQRTPQVVSVSAQCLLHRFYGGPHGWLDKIDALDPEQEAALRLPPVDPASGPVELDESAERLLAVLHHDGRATSTELQASTGLSESVVKQRLEQLRATGVLYFTVQYDRQVLGSEVAAILWLTVSPGALAASGSALATHPEVQFAGAVTGQANLVATTLHRTTDELYAYLGGRIGVLPGVHTVETALTLRQVKQFTYDPAR